MAYDIVDVLALRDEICLNFDRMPVLKIQLEMVSTIANRRKRIEHEQTPKDIKTVIDNERMPELAKNV